jgi:molybdopterin-guanine dinucleotide biosynthesis protein A
MGQDKASLVSPSGESLLERRVRLVGAVAEEVLVVGRQGQLAWADAARAAGACWVTDQGEGPLGALIEALRRASGSCVLLTAVDMPHLVPQLVALLSEELERSGRLASMAQGPRGLEPLCALVAQVAHPPLSELFAAGERSLRRAFAALPAHVVPWDRVRAVDAEGRSFVNLNAPGDVAAWRLSEEEP